MTKEQFELRYGKGPEHEELSELFAEFAFQLDRRLPDGFVKIEMLVYLDSASVSAHKALWVDGTVKNLEPPAETVSWEKYFQKDPNDEVMEIPETKVSLASEVHKAEVETVNKFRFPPKD